MVPLDSLWNPVLAKNFLVEIRQNIERKYAKISKCRKCSMPCCVAQKLLAQTPPPNYCPTPPQIRPLALIVGGADNWARGGLGGVECIKNG